MLEIERFAILQEAKIETVDNKDGTVDVTYLPTEPGDYDLNVTYAQQPVTGAPFKARVVPKGGPHAGPDVSGVKVVGPGTQGIRYWWWSLSVFVVCVIPSRCSLTCVFLVARRRIFCFICNV